MTARICFRIALQPHLVDESVAAHASVWPAMLQAIEQSGRRNYTLCIDRADSSGVGYYETDDDNASTYDLTPDHERILGAHMTARRRVADGGL